MPTKDFVTKLGFVPKENTSGIFAKKYADGTTLQVDFEKKSFHFGGKIKNQGKDTQNISKAEDWVVLECVDRLLTKGYKSENISLEKVYPAGHGFSGRLDICVTREDGSEYLLIECKTYGKEFDKEFNRIKKDGGQLFTYFKFSNKADIIMLYASELRGNDIVYRNEIVKVEDDYRTGDVKDFYEKWNKLTKDNGVFDTWVNPYNFESKALTINDLEEIRQEDSSFIFNRFLEILRHNVVSDKPNAFNKIFNLFLCKIYDEKDKEGIDEELDFQWIEGKDDDITFQLRLTDLFKKGMKDFLEKEVTDFSDDDFENQYASIFAGNDNLKAKFKNDVLYKLRLEKNNEFAIKEVYDQKSFIENAKVVKEVVELLQRFKIRYTQKQQYLSDFFELLLTTGLKQESGQFFTPVPIAQFVIKSLPIDKIVEDKLIAGKKDDLLPFIIDYAAGSGHFLTESMHEVQRLLLKIDNRKLKSEARSFVDVSKIRHFDWALQYIYGIEKDYRLVKVGKVGCYLHGDGLANVIHSDGLANFKHDDYKGKLGEVDKNFPQENKQFDIIVSNPPYAIDAFRNASKDYYSKQNFDLYENLSDTSSEIECLFLERTKQLLKDGGVAGIIIPISVLTKTSELFIRTRKMILESFDIVAIAELGSNTFMAADVNTATLFLRRRNNYESINLRKLVEKFFTNYYEVTLNGIEKPVTQYLNHVWEGITFDDYLSLLKKNPNSAIAEHEIYQEYKKKLKVKNEKEFWSKLLEIETEKLFYFIIVWPQKLVVVKSGDKKEEREFLGYEFSFKKGKEGIHSIRKGRTIDECTKLFDIEVFDNVKKASTYIYNAFRGNYDVPISGELSNNIFKHDLIEVFSFERIDFNLNISTEIKNKIIIPSKWNNERLENIFTEIKNGKNVDQINEVGKYRVSRIETISNATFNIEATKWTNDNVNDEDFLQYGDILFSHINSKEHIGKTAIFRLKEKVVHGTNLLKLRADRAVLLPEYAFAILRSSAFVNEVKKYAQKAANQASINSTNLKNLKIPVPPLDIQQSIISEINILLEKSKSIVVADLEIQIEKILKSYL